MSFKSLAVVHSGDLLLPSCFSTLKVQPIINSLGEKHFTIFALDFNIILPQCPFSKKISLLWIFLLEIASTFRHFLLRILETLWSDHTWFYMLLKLTIFFFGFTTGSNLYFWIAIIPVSVSYLANSFISFLTFVPEPFRCCEWLFAK